MPGTPYLLEAQTRNGDWHVIAATAWRDDAVALLNRHEELRTLEARSYRIRETTAVERAAAWEPRS